MMAVGGSRDGKPIFPEQQSVMLLVPAGKAGYDEHTIETYVELDGMYHLYETSLFEETKRESPITIGE